MQNKPFFSIITCTYNSEKFIEQNVDSVVKQTFTQYEHIIIDGNSTDSTIQKITNTANPLCKIASFKPMGISNALNKGISVSNGAYLIHLNSDDFFADKYILEKIHGYIVKNSFPDVVYGKIQTIEEDGTLIGVFPRQSLLQQANYHLLRYINFVPHQATFVKKEVFDKFGDFDESLSSSMDYDFWLRIMDSTRWIFFDSLISNFRVRKGAQSTDKNNMEINKKNLDFVLYKHLNIFELSVAKISNFVISKINTLYR